MKKGVVLAVCGVLLLCAVIGGGLAAYFLFFSKSPAKAFKTAVKEMTEGDYYQMSSDGSMTASVSAPSMPDFDMTFKMDMSGESKVDVQGEKMYTKMKTTMEGMSTTAEAYVIGEDYYIKTDGDWEKVSKDEASEASNEMDALKDLSPDAEYTLLEEQNVEGVDCYHYEVALDDEMLKDFTDAMTASMQGSNPEDEFSDIVVDDAKIELWISKADSRIIKSDMKIAKITVKGTSQGVELEMVISDVAISSVYSNWGEKVDIQAPI
ncbi:MAG: hypothetical protein PHS44_06075 [Candidatus Dojkabacteria bacterium]|nr:hypothetical protein [Candidatus Dojkabacteria bacterium]